MDDRAFKVTVEDGSDVNEVEEQPDDEEPRYWLVCRFHRIAEGRIWRGLLARMLRERLADYISEETRVKRNDRPTFRGPLLFGQRSGRPD